MKSFWEGFKKFITRGNVIDMAVGVAVGTAFTAIVTAFNKGIISPLLSLLSSTGNLADIKWVIRSAVTEMVDGEEVIVSGEVAIMFGTFLQAIIDFLLISFTLFCILRIVNRFMNRADRMAKKMKKAMRSKKQIAADEAAEKAKAEAEAAKAAEEEKAAQAEQEERRRIAAQEQAQADTVALLREIRDFMQKNQ